MNKFVHRILSHRTKSALSSPEELFLDGIRSKRVTWLGEFHSEARILALQNELVVRWARHLGGIQGGGGGVNDEDSSAMMRPRLHVIMEHFSMEMQPLLDKFQTDPTFTVEDLEEEYRRVGTEGHALEPYRGFLNFCRWTTLRRRGGGEGAAAGPDDGAAAAEHEVPLQDEIFASSSPADDDDDEASSYCDVLLHGGFVPRPYAARWNKCADVDEKRGLLEEIAAKGWLPSGEEGHESAAMRRAVFGPTDEEKDALLLRGSKEHYRLVESLMNGQDLYTPVVDASDAAVEEEDDDTTIDQTAPLAKLYQAQLLKDHAMGYFLANLLLNHASCPHSRRNDRYLVLAGYGHVKHYLGVPACLEGYLKAESLYHPDAERREAASDVLSNLIGSSGKEPSGQVMIGSQMMYETYLEEKYPPLIDAEAMEDEGEEREEAKRTALFDLYRTELDVMDRLLLESEIVRGPLLNPSAGQGKFGRPCADYLFVYDEDDDNILPPPSSEEEDGSRQEGAEEAAAAKAASAKAETLEAYDRVGQTAGRRGNVVKARAIMLQLGYTEADLEVVGEDDMYNFQGVANPHRVARIRRGERVLDVGSGLGVDSFLAARACGADGNKDGNSGSGNGGSNEGPVVVGVDLAPAEVSHANRRAVERGCDPSLVRFLAGDAERLDEALTKGGIEPSASSSFFDVCISNGAFCLIPDKRRAFEGVYRALRPGGRMAVSTTTVRTKGGGKLDPKFEWPVCMRMFVNLDDVVPICESVGFKNVRLVDAESPLEGIELPEEAIMVEEEERQRTSSGGGNGKEQRFKIHGKYTEHFKHLEKMDMDELCKVVTVYGEK